MRSYDLRRHSVSDASDHSHNVPRGRERACGRSIRHFADAEKECQALLAKKLPRPAYDQCIKASHCFNLLDARGVISVTERASYIGRVRALAKASCDVWLDGQGT